MSGAMPRRAWLEIHDPDGQLLAKVESRIKRGTVIQIVEMG